MIARIDQRPHVVAGPVLRRVINSGGIKSGPGVSVLAMAEVMASTPDPDRPEVLPRRGKGETHG